MKQSIRLTLLIVWVGCAGLLAACGAPASLPASDTVKKIQVESSPATAAQDTSATAAGTQWVTAPMISAANGEIFRLADYKGKVVLVEMMAVWCTNCLQEQGHVRDLHQKASSEITDKVVSLSVDVDPNEGMDQLKAYRTKQGFTWDFTVAPQAVAREISNLYGAQFLNPSAVPMLIIDKEGGIHPLPFGIKTVDALQEALKPYL